MRLFAWTLLALCTVPAARQRLLPASNVEEFLLKVRLIDPTGPTEIQTRIVTQQRFEFSEMHNSAKITIKGELAERRKNSYHLKLTLVEWASQKSNSTETYELDLVPGEAQSRAFVSSFIFHRTILLTRLPVTSRFWGILVIGLPPSSYVRDSEARPQRRWGIPG